MGKKSKVFYVLFLVWLIWRMFSLSYPEPQPEIWRTDTYMGTIIEYEQTPTGLQFEMESYNRTDFETGEPLKMTFVITDDTEYKRDVAARLTERLENSETGLFVRVWTEYLEGSIEDERRGPFPLLTFEELEVE